MKRIDTVTRQKVIQLHKEGKEIKEIHQILNNANIKISYGTTWNIVEASRSQSEPSTQVDQSPLNSTIPDDLMRDYSYPAVDKSGPSGCPLSRFIPQEEIPEIKDSDLESLSITQEKKANDQPTIKNTITNDPEDIDILDIDSEPDIYTDPNTDYDEEYDGDPTNSLQKELDSNYEHEARLKRYKRIQEPSDEDDESISIPTVILEQIEQEKAQRKNERLSIQRDKEILARREKYLEDAKKEIDQARNDLDIRETRILQVESLLPLARQMQELSLGFDDIIPWIEIIREKAHMENIDLKTAAYNVTHELREYRQLGGLHKAVEQVKQQLAVLDAFTAQKQQAITTLMNLQLAGFSEKDINELIGLVTAWNRSGIWGLGFSQGDGRSSGFKLDDKLIDIGH